MLLNKNIVLEIIRSNFGEQIEFESTMRVMDMHGYELEEIFDFPIDYALLDLLGEMEVEEYSVAEDGKTVTGVLQVEAFIEGYVHWDGSDEYWGSGETVLGFKFGFKAEDEKVSEFELWPI